MKMPGDLFLSFVGPSGVGKSTCYDYAEKFLQEQEFYVYRHEVAHPLRLIQESAYELLDLDPQGNPDDPTCFRQDGALLGFLAEHFGDQLGKVFATDFESCFDSRNPECPIAVVNTDCRNNAYDTLKALGFTFVRLEVDEETLLARRQARGDTSPFNYAALVESTNRIETPYIIFNNGSLDELKISVTKVIDRILQERAI